MESSRATSLLRRIYTGTLTPDTRESLIKQIPKLDRVKRVEIEFIDRRNEDSGLKLTADQIEIRSISLEDHLTSMGVHPDQYPAIYKKAVQIYNPDKGLSPFGIDYIIRAAKLLNQPRPKEIRLNKQVYICTECKDTGFELNGLLPKTVEIEGRKEKVKCEACR